MKTAIVIGATGLTGSLLLKHLLDDKRYEKVIVFSRRKPGVEHSKLVVHIVDLLKLEKQKDKFIADEVFCCIGTTNKKTPDNKEYKKIDYGIPATAAKLCHENKIPTFMVISAMGADPSSKLFYSRAKGEMEQAVLQQKIDNTYILRPSLIGGKREEKRPEEHMAKQVMKIANFLMLGPLKKYRSVHPDKIVKCMLYLANHDYKTSIIESDLIQEIAKDR